MEHVHRYMSSNGHKDNNVLIHATVYQLTERTWKWQNCGRYCGNYGCMAFLTSLITLMMSCYRTSFTAFIPL